MSSSHRISGTGARIDLRAVTKTYRGADQPAVKGIDLSINEGEFMTFLGGSGAGKTTTLNMIAGFESITSGGILLDGDDISRLPPHKRGLGMVFQNYALFPHMSVFDNVAFPLKQRKVGRTELRKKVNETLDLVQLGRFSDRLPGQLSGGQQQRVALARAIVFSPRVLLLDEPLGALDKKLRELLQVEISRIHRELGLTFVYVTHDQEEALGMSDRITLFQDGQIAQVGTPKEIYENPDSRFVATFLGESNIFSGKLRGNLLDTGHGELSIEGQLNSGSSGSEVELMVRPEHMTIGATSEPGANSLNAIVTEVIYQGAFRRVSVEFEGGVRGQVREGANSAHGGISISVGERISVSWRPERAVLLNPTDNTRIFDKALTG